MNAKNIPKVLSYFSGPTAVAELKYIDKSAPSSKWPKWTSVRCQQVNPSGTFVPAPEAAVACTHTLTPNPTPSLTTTSTFSLAHDHAGQWVIAFMGSTSFPTHLGD